jgi:hypothetical protein
MNEQIKPTMILKVTTVHDVTPLVHLPSAGKIANKLI